MSAHITFHGGAGTVTGANFLFEALGKKILVDCGARERENICDIANHVPFPYAAPTIDVLIITHAHQDHIGLVPKLVREGFRGIIYSTPATRDLSEIMLQDAAHVMGMDAERSGCDAIFELSDVEKTMPLWQTHEYHEPFAIGDVQVEFSDAGHILGSALVKFTRATGSPTSVSSGSLTSTSRPIVFTGDLGNSPEPLLCDTEAPEGAAYLVMESVYGDKVHEGREDRREVLRRAIDGARAKHGTLLMPCFSLERTQIILFELHQMIQEGTLKPIPVYLDSPLAERVMGVFRKYVSLFNPTAREAFQDADAFTFPQFVDVSVGEASHQLHGKPDPKVIIAGAGMSNGGRIRAHEKVYLPDPKASILLTGFQAPGSLGRRIQDGTNSVMIDRERVSVRASVSALTGYSGHKDRDGLVDFAASAGDSLQRVFVVMGEPKASNFLAQRLTDFIGVPATVPKSGERIEIDW